MLTLIPYRHCYWWGGVHLKPIFSLFSTWEKGLTAETLPEQVVERLDESICGLLKVEGPYNQDY